MKQFLRHFGVMLFIAWPVTRILGWITLIEVTDSDGTNLAMTAILGLILYSVNREHPND